MRTTATAAPSRAAALAAVLLLSDGAAAPLRAAERNYVGPNPGTWNNPAHWSATPGGPPGAGVPKAGDHAAVAAVAGSDRDVTFDGNYPEPDALRGLTLTATGGATATLRQPANRLAAGETYISGNSGGNAPGHAVFDHSGGVNVANSLLVAGSG